MSFGFTCGLSEPPRPGALVAALGRPQNLLAYGDPAPDLPMLTAAYGFGLARDHCFPDGNKRVALATMDVFLQLNGYELTAADSAETVATIRALAAGEVTDTELGAWVTANCKPLDLNTEPAPTPR